MIISGIALGVGAPNQCSDGRKTKCAILFTEQLGLIRVYPIPAERPFPVWGIVDCEVTRNEKDMRRESYKIAPDFEVDKKVHPDFRRELLEECCLKSGTVDPIDYQNEHRSSIALVKHDFGKMTAAMSQRVPGVLPNDPEFGWITVQSSYHCKPYLTWQSKQGKEHTSHLAGAEVYNGLRKNPGKEFNIYNNMRVMDPDYERWLLLGNMRDRRNVWVIVHLHRMMKRAAIIQQPIFPLYDKPQGWPYMSQEITNEKAADNQLALFAI